MNISITTAAALILSVPACLFLISLLVNWRYRLQVEAAMASTAAASTSSGPSTRMDTPGSSAARAPLDIQWIRAERDPEELSGPRFKWIAWNHLRERRQAVQRAVWMAVALHFIVSIVAILPTLHIRLGFRLPYAYELALPELAICLFGIGASRRTWAFGLLVYAASGLALVPGAAGFLHFVKFLEIFSPAAAVQLAGLALILPGRLRPVAISLAAFAIFALVEGGILAAFFWDSAPFLSFQRGAYAFGPTIAAHVAGVILFLLMARRRSTLRPAVILLAMAAAAFGLGKLFVQLAWATAIVEAQPFIVLSCYLVWLIFRGLKWLQSRRLVTGDLFHMYLAWAFVTFTNVGLAGVGGDSHSIRRSVLAAAAFPLLVATLQYTLWRYSRHLQRSPAKQLVLLRTFGQSRNALRLLETLRDTWRLFGSVELISGTDLAGRVLAPAMFEAYLQNRVKDLFLKSPAEVDRQIAHLDRRILNDGRYPINELSCFSNAWGYAVERLVPRADVVLMDLRNFSKAHLGCVFELTQLLNLVPLERVLLLVDARTDREALQEVIQEAWTNLTPESPSRLNGSPRLEILNLQTFNDAARRSLLSRLLVAAGA